ncbi:hypothetical protein [Crenothrix sp.]|uniref:hypothetical protein n=1 Tax=Crenothrix sp. TaxID=3100433 RepID=UPI00374D9556
MNAVTSKTSLALIVAIGLLTTPPVFAVDKDQQLIDQVQHYWGAQAKRDWNTMYGFLSPNEQATMTRAQYSEYLNKTTAFDYNNVQIKDKEIVDNMAWVAIEYDAKLILYPNAAPRHVQNWQLWQNTDTWHLIPSEQSQHYPRLPPKLRLATEETALMQRAKDAWSAKSIQDWKTFYSFLPSAYRTLVNLDSFLQKKSQYLYLNPNIDWAEVTQALKDKGLVEVSFAIKPNDPAASKLEPEPKNMLEKWFKQDGNWYIDVPLPTNKSASPKH